MASRNRPPRKVTAEQALRLFQEDLAERNNSDVDLELVSSESESDERESNRSSVSDSSEDDLVTCRSCLTGPSRPKKSKGNGIGKRSRPQIEESPSSSGDARSRPRPVCQESEGWKQVPTKKPSCPEHKTTTSYRFVPTQAPGVIADLNENSSAFTCLQTILDNDVIDSLCSSIIEFAIRKSAMNNPSNRRSVHGNWIPIEREELLGFMTVNACCWIEQKAENQGLFYRLHHIGIPLGRNRKRHYREARGNQQL
ncbi:hypothetical protein PoB_006776500 [Plakobranchus ocellatus]|uniref:PiggyBac transposable element-derived protein domain-containing protein n=1 Tax=Plakobranchus ocellatus TaxID=259542 RepID=A0AAV4DAY2_9GAST|nr:hypothetical protein PoB_006776500 [Plakobranchus ocellatus]